MTSNDHTTDEESIETLTSEDLAAHIIDALLQAGILEEASVEHAIKIAAEEIEARKVMGDY